MGLKIDLILIRYSLLILEILHSINYVQNDKTFNICASHLLIIMIKFKELIVTLENQLAKDNLPGLPSQLKMAPVTRINELSSFSDDSAKKSAVLILFYPKNNQTHIALIKRSTDNSVHSAQISFPGGKTEITDKSLKHTALREAEEEVGINPNSVKIIGSLTQLYIPPSNFDVYPFVGVTYSTPDFKPNYEVQKIVEVDLVNLMNPETCTYKKIQHRTGNDFVVPCYYIQEEIIWGATAMIISELLEIVLVNGELLMVNG